MNEAELFHPTRLSALAALIYLATAALALAVASRSRRGPAPTSTPAPAAWRSWLAVAACFAVLAAIRLANADQALHDHVRDWAESSGIYGERHDLQIPLTLAGLTGLFGVFVWLTLRAWPLERVVIARTAALVLALLALMRMVSLHAVDALLYRAIGPVHVNYVLDIGLTFVVIAMAAAEWLEPPKRRPKPGA
jgi:hypothetical protein